MGSEQFDEPLSTRADAESERDATLWIPEPGTADNEIQQYCDFAWTNHNIRVDHVGFTHVIS